MSKRTCTICDAKHYGHGYCKPHYKRWVRHGDPTHVPQRPTADERFWSHVTKTPDCWLWGGQSRNGYGLFSWTVEKYRTTSTGAHRYAYEALKGPIPEGLVLDHLCRVPLCVNPDHLEPVTLGENVLRGIGPSATSRRRTQCSKGHPYTTENTYYNKKGHRACRTCGREAALRKFRKQGANPVSEAAKKKLRDATSENRDASVAEIAGLLGWSEGHTRHVRAAVYGPQQKQRGTCSITGCENPAEAHGWCNKHYTRWRKHGDPLYERPKAPPFCTVDGCEAESYSRGMCRRHYREQQAA